MTATAIGQDWDLNVVTLPSSGSPNEKPESKNAYLRGLQDGMVVEKRQTQDKFMKALNDGLKLSHTHTREVFSYLRKCKMQPKGARLRIRNLEHYEVLVMLPTRQFLSKKMRAVYEHLHERKNKWATEKYEVNFRFVSASGPSAEAHMTCDGFELSFVEDAAKRAGK